MDILYTNRSRIYLGRTTLQLEIRPTIRSDAIVRKPDMGGEKFPKMALFSRFFDYLTYFPTSYQLQIINEGKR